MATIIDYSQVAISVLVQDIAQSPRGVTGEVQSGLTEDFVRHLIINTVRSHVVRNRDKGETILAVDGRYTWRRDMFKPYKGRRRMGKEEENDTPDANSLDWDMINRVLTETRVDLSMFFPIKVVCHDSAEADDVIGVAARLWRKSGDRLHIISGDKDFKQLQRMNPPIGHPVITQYSPTLKTDIVEEDPNRQLGELILKGDAGDGVPNIYSDDNVFVEFRRSNSVTAKMKEEFFRYWKSNGHLDPDFFNAYEAGNLWEGASKGSFDKKTGEWKRDPIPVDELRRRFERNKKLVDLRETPDHLASNIIEQLDTPPRGDVMSAMMYFSQRGMKRLMESAGDWA